MPIPVAGMRRRDLPVTYLVFPDEGHGFAKPENRLAFYAIAEAFLSRWLGGRADRLGSCAELSAELRVGADAVAQSPS